MGFYIDTDRDHDKADWLIEKAKGKKVTLAEAKEAIKDPTKAVIVVVHNFEFEAAAFAYKQSEFEYFIDTKNDDRQRDYVVMPRELAEQLAGGFMKFKERSMGK